MEIHELIAFIIDLAGDDGDRLDAVATIVGADEIWCRMAFFQRFDDVAVTVTDGGCRAAKVDSDYETGGLCVALEMLLSGFRL